MLNIFYGDMPEAIYNCVKMLDYLKPDIWSMADDTAAKETPFFSPEYPKYDEEVLRQSVRDAMDKYAPGGGYAFYHSGLVSYFGDPVVEDVKRIIRDEAHWYGRKIYGYTGE